MTKIDVIKHLSTFSNGGNAFLVFSYLLSLKQDQINISQEKLAKEINKTRPAIQSSLELLKKEGYLDLGYKKIKILKGIYD